MTLKELLALIPPYHAGQPKFMAMLEATFAPFIAAADVARSLPHYFDLDTAIGVQLDATGAWIGRDRYVRIPIPGAYFSFDVAGLSRQYKRSCQVTLGSGSGGGLNIEAWEDDVGHPGHPSVRVRFHVQHAELGVPQHADIVIYNLAEATEQQIQKEFTKITLKAGYGGDNQIVFQGELIQKRTFRENPVDTCIALLAKDSDRAHNYAVVSKTLPPGSTYRQQVEECLKVMKPFGVTPGYIGDLGSKRMPKSRVLHGMARDLLRQIGQATNTAWSIQGGKLQMVKNDGFIPGAPFVLNSRTGLIGRPEQTIDGIIVRCLLNPRIRPGTRMKIDQKSINQAAFSPAYTAEVNNAMIPGLATDGLYKVLFVDEDGDTRGPPWYTTATCIKATGGTLPLGLAARGITDPSDVPAGGAQGGQ